MPSSSSNSNVYYNTMSSRSVRTAETDFVANSGLDITYGEHSVHLRAGHATTQKVRVNQPSTKSREHPECLRVGHATTQKVGSYQHSSNSRSADLHLTSVTSAYQSGAHQSSSCSADRHVTFELPAYQPDTHRSTHRGPPSPYPQAKPMTHGSGIHKHNGSHAQSRSGPKLLKKDKGDFHCIVM